MNRFFPAILAASGLCCTIWANVNPGDNLLYVNVISEEQIAQFSTKDGEISPFWADWEGKDYIDMNTTNNSYPGRDNWDGTDDAKMTVKALASPQGLYFYCEVQDNVWVDKTPGEGQIQYDCVELYFDNLTSAEIIAGGDEIKVNPAWGWHITYTSVQIQVWMGATQLPDYFMYNVYDELYWTYSFSPVSFAGAAEMLDGLNVEVISLDATRKAQEWFIPWSRVGAAGVKKNDQGIIEAGTTFAFTAGYNDMDGDGGEQNCLRWLQYDPFNTELGGNSWGNLEIASDVAVGISQRAPRQSTVHHFAPEMTRQFTLDGKRIQAGAQAARSGLVIERSVDAKGVAVSKILTR